MANNKFKLMLDGKPYDLERRDGLMVVNGVEFSCALAASAVLVAGVPHQVKLSPGQAEVDGINYQIEALGLAEQQPARQGQSAAKPSEAHAGTITAIMPGLIIKLLKQEGDPVQAGETVLILEAMKMQNELHAKTSGVLRKLLVKQGDNVEMRQPLCIIE